MSRKSFKATRVKGILFIFFTSLLFFALWTTSEILKLKKSTQKGWFDPPTEFYTAPIELNVGQTLDASRLASLLNTMGFEERGFNQSLAPDEFTFMPDNSCQNRFEMSLDPSTRTCFYIVLSEDERYLIELSYERITTIYVFEFSFPKVTDKAQFKPMLFSQSANKKPIKRSYIELSHIPRYCIDAILATEDDRFLKHNGVSLRGIFRAALANLKSGRFSQGGSTLTQQLVKNKYLSSAKTLSRKIKEAWISLLLEIVMEKDEILESYVNYIYWGQSGPYTIHGIEEASKHYFNKSVEKLDLSECSLLAGAIKGPGVYGPDKEKSKDRQMHVLERMKKLKLITSIEEREALEKETFVSVFDSIAPPKAPYYVDAVFKFLESRGIKKTNGLKVYTYLDFFMQNALEESLDKHLKGQDQGFYGSVLVGDPETRGVKALASGTSRSRNFNSALDAKRQVGSLAKPFVYLTAFNELENLTAVTDIPNAPFVYDYEGQSWSPKNYSSDPTPYYPVYEALAKSKNRPTVKLMSEFGYKAVYKNLIDFGFTEFSPVTPSLALGSFEATPLQVLGAFLNFSNFQENPVKPYPLLVKEVVDRFDGSSLFKSKTIARRLNKEASNQRVVLEILKNTLKIGTAKKALTYNLQGVYAGKTGTTNDHKDGWFVAMNPENTFVTWVGEAPYLTEKGVKLTGSSAALPIWLKFIKNAEQQGLITEKDWDQMGLQPLEIQGPFNTINLLIERDQ